MQPCRTVIPRPSQRCPLAGLLVAIALSCLTAACTISAPPTPTKDPIYERWPACSDEDQLAVNQIDAPYFPIPDSPNCAVQLLVMSDKTYYDPGNYVTIITMLKLHGDCTLQVLKTHHFIEFYPSVITDEAGAAVPLTESGRKMKESGLDWPGRNTRGLLTNEQGFCIRLPIDEWYDLSAPGVYTLTLVRFGVGEGYQVPGNPVTFTRLP